ncbi:hypothetical protein [Natronobacterium gregoryi]|uniref:Uncharacterized protein n=2 Tax=Natronobacterium gregoryi TaxID=44930 RepID=L0AGT0_NATGS|nr:hypothetical protein [Natronobacterium gregoryi]AFZ73026.1 hypothetical protein Natgr_1841 [Natronobacterium gregoryi SP2]ELY70711.1 hypothetical protein C490_06234 [Natronobacterium gregoryi SP2]PLK20360.1 hypothetical protein CYV19_09980 [Natronobacterium gregoryi SP2]SFI63303.1 hypothetical protein SAMN05443661_102240 [Natronobacterium gregoryi]
MSTTSTPSTDGHVSPQRAFDRIIWANPRVCNGCFERIKEIEEATFSGGVNDHDVQEHHRTPQATLEPDEQIQRSVDAATGSLRRDDPGEATSRPGQQRTSIARTTCRSCARIGCWADDDTLSKVQAVRLTSPIAERLEDAGVEFDSHALRRAVRLFKERDDVQGYDTEIFRRSVKLAVQRA